MDGVFGIWYCPLRERRGFLFLTPLFSSQMSAATATLLLGEFSNDVFCEGITNCMAQKTKSASM